MTKKKVKLKERHLKIELREAGIHSTETVQQDVSYASSEAPNTRVQLSWIVALRKRYM